MPENVYRDDKILMHLDRLHALRLSRVPAPIHVHFVPSDKCNQNCNFCAYRIDGYTEFFAEKRPDGTLRRNPHRMMPYEKARGILSDCAKMGVKAIEFTGGGEPTVHPHCAGLMNYARSLGMETALVTNGWKMGEDIRAALLSATWVRISLDCATPDTYQKERRVPGTVLAEVLENIKALVAARNKAQSSLVIGIGYVITEDNWQEVIRGVELARDLGVDNIRLSAVFQAQNASYFDGFGEDAARRCRMAVTLSTDTFRVINNFDLRFGELLQGSPEFKRCPFQTLVPYIGADLNVYRCCVMSYRKRGLVASLANQTLEQLWTSEEYRQDYLNFDARGCERCQFLDRNRTINRFIDMDIPHGAFV